MDHKRVIDYANNQETKCREIVIFDGSSDYFRRLHPQARYRKLINIRASLPPDGKMYYSVGKEMREVTLQNLTFLYVCDIALKMKTIDESNYDAVVMNNNRPVIIDFWASWCKPCSNFMPIFQEVAEEFPTVQFGKVQVDALENAGIVEEWNVRSIPRVVGYFNKQRFTLEGNLTRETLRKFVENVRLS